MNNLSFGGWDTFRERPFAYYETIAGGMGASPRGPGRSATHTHMTNSWNTPIEAFEHEYPLRVRAYQIRAGSGGAGKHAGGDGIVRELEFLEPAEVTILSDRRKRGPYGLQGGANGVCGSSGVIKEGSYNELPSKTRFVIQRNEVLRIETPGGGGWEMSLAQYVRIRLRREMIAPVTEYNTQAIEDAISATQRNFPDDIEYIRYYTSGY